MSASSARQGGARSARNSAQGVCARDQSNGAFCSEDGGSLRLSVDQSLLGDMSVKQKENSTQELLRRLCATSSSDRDVITKRFQKALVILKSSKTTGFNDTAHDEHIYIEKIRDHLNKTQGSEAADKFLKLSSQLALRCHSRDDYLSKRTALHSFFLTLTTGTDDANSNPLPQPAQSEKLNSMFRRQKANRGNVRPLSTPTTPVEPMDSASKKKALKSTLNLLVARSSTGIIVKSQEGKMSFSINGVVRTLDGYRIANSGAIANLFVQLQHFVLQASKAKSLVVQRLAEAVEQQLLRHRQLIAMLEQMATADQLSPARMEYLCLQPDNLIYSLALICEPFIEKVNIMNGNHVLDVLFEQTASSPVDSDHFKLAHNLLQKVLSPWLEMLHAWMLRGDLSNSHWDFFIRNIGREGVSNLWYDKFAIQEEYVPAFLNEEDTVKILSVGKAMLFLKETDNLQMITDIRTHLKEAFTQKESQGNALREAYTLTMERMKAVTLDKFHLRTHFLMIRDVILLYDAVFSNGLLSHLSNDSSPTQGHFERSEINRMVNLLLPEYPNIEASAFIGVNFNSNVSTSSTMENFCLTYKLQEPLSFIFRNKSFVSYNQIFAHLFRVRKFSYLFKELSCELFRTKVASKAISRHLAQSKIFLQEIMNFVSNLESYLFSHVVTTAWTELENRCAKFISVNDLSDAHAFFVSNLMKGLFLDGDDPAGMHLRSLFVDMDEIYLLVRKLLDGVEASRGSENDGLQVLLHLFAKYDSRIKRYRLSMLEFLKILSEHEDDKMVQFLWMNFDFNLFYSEQHHSLKMSTTQAYRNKVKTSRTSMLNSMNASVMNMSTY